MRGPNFPSANWARLIRFFKSHGVRQGADGRPGAPRCRYFPSGKPTAKFLRFLSKVKDRTTTSLLATLADFFAARASRSSTPRSFLKDHLVAAKNYTPRRGSARTWGGTSNSAGKKPGASPPWISARPLCVKGRAVVAVEGHGRHRPRHRAGGGDRRPRAGGGQGQPAGP